MHSPIAAHLHAPFARVVLFVVQRAFDGWIALDLAGPSTDAVRARCGATHVVTRGGAAHTGRIFTLHDRLDEVARGRALTIGHPRGPRFVFGGDLSHLLDPREHSAFPRLRLFRGLTVLRDHDPRLAHAIPATHELVFDTPPARIRAAFEAECATYRLTPQASRVHDSSRTLATPVLLDHRELTARNRFAAKMRSP